VTSRWLVNTAGVFGGTLAGWFGETAPVEALMPNMLVTEPLPRFRQPLGRRLRRRRLSAPDPARQRHLRRWPRLG